ncbi:hypothetical protein [Scytonema sp. HK-05]|uniref:hypothetical protein n=1 Tax=Scytonema sp. HK-05 TaxID=1137095 RepID=UPI000B034DBA|nr:hypothetical protein [Scytonema sp. HK-05]
MRCETRDRLRSCHAERNGSEASREILPFGQNDMFERNLVSGLVLSVIFLSIFLGARCERLTSRENRR